MQNNIDKESLISGSGINYTEKDLKVISKLEKFNFQVVRAIKYLNLNLNINIKILKY
jgi:hypothetical protein